MYISSKCCVHVLHDVTIANAIHFTLVYSQYYHKLIIKDNKFHIMNSMLLQNVKSTLWKDMFQYICIVLMSIFCPSFIFIFVPIFTHKSYT
jgi:hypothetical protein